MKKRYNEIMDKIEVTDEMRKRILDRVTDYDFEKAVTPKVIKFSSRKRYLSIAACFAVLLAGMLTIPHLFHTEQPQDPILSQPGNGIMEVASIQELSASVGFEVEDIAELPFVPEKCVYIVYWDELAEIVYTGGEQTVIFRKSVGSKDNSGDFNDYSVVKEISVDTKVVTIKGDNDSYNLMVWTDGEYSYSLRSSNGLTETEWRSILIKTD